MMIRTEICIILLLTLGIIVKKGFAYQPYKNTDPDYAASVHHLKLLVLTELDILISAFSSFITELRFGSNANLMEYIEDFETSHVKSLDSTMPLDQFISLLEEGHIDKENFADESVKHPFKSYRTIRRFVKYVKHFPHTINTEELVETVNNASGTVPFPKKSDLEASMQNVLRLRQIFSLSVDDLFNGQLGNFATGSGLKVTHLRELAEHAMTLKMFSQAVDLYDGILKRCGVALPEEVKECSVMDSEDLYVELDKVIKLHDDLLIGNKYNRSDLDVVPPDSSPYVFDAPLRNSTASSFVNRRRIQIDLDFDKFAKTTNHSKLELDMAASPFLFEKLCGGFQVQKSDTNYSHYRCTYLHNTHPYYLIGPLKAEIHQENPLIIQIYDVLSVNEMNELKSEVQQEMRQSRTTAVDGDGDDNAGKTSRFRTSANAWIEDDSNEKFKYLNERISRITGLNATGYFSSEILQIAAYNPGGHYTPHSDAMFEEVVVKLLPLSEFERGDRIMTFMIYLSNVEKGGGTGFTTVKTVINPVAGSAVAWYNLNSDGTINYDAMHGGCPVLYGTKWIANKWIRSNDQMFIRPCPKNKEPWKI